MPRRSKAADEIGEVTESIEGVEMPDETPAQAAQAQFEHPGRVFVTVKFNGPGQAVLGNELILHGETRRNVSRAVLQIAERHHPGEFEIIG